MERVFCMIIFAGPYGSFIFSSEKPHNVLKVPTKCVLFKVEIVNIPARSANCNFIIKFINSEID